MSRLPLIIFIGLGILALIAVAALLGVGRKEGAPPAATIEFWGLEDESVWRGAFQKLYETKPHLTVNYKRLDETSYETVLVNRLAEGRGPDVFLLKNTWIKKHRDKVFPFPADFFKIPAREVIAPFADGPAAEILTPEGALLGLPLSIDSPVLLYNKDMLNAAGIAALPRTWTDFALVVRKLSSKTPAGDLIKSGGALGTYREITYAFEVLSTFFLQHGDAVVNRIPPAVALGDQAIQALETYTSFANPSGENFSWSGRFGNSFDAFVEERTAIVPAFTQDISRLRSRNAHLNIGVLPFPQLKEARVPVVYARYYFPVVSTMSRRKTQAWELVMFLASREAAEAYTKATGRPPSRRDLLSENAPSQELAVAYRQALIAKGWPVPDEPAVARLFEGAVDAVVNRRVNPSRAIAELREKMELLLRQ